jgi:hypothetical protein
MSIESRWSNAHEKGHLPGFSSLNKHVCTASKNAKLITFDDTL